MTGPENYKRAETLLESAWKRSAHDGGTFIQTAERRSELIAAAQVHATLALAAATAMAARLNDTLSGFAVGMDTPDQKAWDKVAGVGR